MLKKKMITTYQEKFFLDVYKTVLHARLSSKEDVCNIDINDAIYNATCIALISVDNIFNEHGDVRETNELISMIKDKRIDRDVDFPQIEEK